MCTSPTNNEETRILKWSSVQPLNSMVTQNEEQFSNYKSILKAFQQIGHKSITQSQGQNPQHVWQQPFTQTRKLTENWKNKKNKWIEIAAEANLTKWDSPSPRVLFFWILNSYKRIAYSYNSIGRWFDLAEAKSPLQILVSFPHTPGVRLSELCSL